MYDGVVRRAALDALADGDTLSTVSRATGISRSAIRSWRLSPGRNSRSDCPVCESGRELDHTAYSHLLGLYLGDGCISVTRSGVYALRITCDSCYPRLLDEVASSVRLVHPAGRVSLVPRVGCVDVQGCWKHWVCLFPQHGPGRKHLRPIELTDWQETIVRQYLGPFVRGLFHSDGCRVTNWTVKSLPAGPKRYEYPRYFFSNESADIIGLCTWALDQLGVRWTLPRANCVSVARRASVAVLDGIVGPKS